MSPTVAVAATDCRLRLRQLLLRSMRACVHWPRWLAPFKAIWLITGLLLLEVRPLRPGNAGEVRDDRGLVLAGSVRASMLNRILAYRGVYEPGLSDFIDRHVESGDTCLDVGANVGYFSLLLARRVGTAGQVLAVEAAPGNVNKLRQNLAANGWTERVRVLAAALTNFSGDCTFYVNTRNDMHCRLTLPGRFERDSWLMGRPRWRAVNIPAMTLDQVLGDDAARVSFVKLDIEGAEHLVAAQVVALCTHERLCVAMEVKAPHVRAALDPFEQAGFHLYDLHNDYRWLLDSRPPRLPSPMAYAQAHNTRHMVDVLLCRQPIPSPGPTATRSAQRPASAAA